MGAMSSPSVTSDANKPVRLIFVDDDDDYREAASAELVDLGFVVESFADGASMLASVADGIVADVIVLDWSLPTMSGIDLLPRLRREGIQLPVVFLTGRSSQSHEHLAFDRGALDFVDKSRGVPILAKRIRVIVESSKRPVELEVDETERCGRLMLKPRVSHAFWDANRPQPDCNRVQRRANAGVQRRQPRDLPRDLRLLAPRRLHYGQRRTWLPSQCPFIDQADTKQVPSHRSRVLRDRELCLVRLPLGTTQRGHQLKAHGCLLLIQIGHSCPSRGDALPRCHKVIGYA